MALLTNFIVKDLTFADVQSKYYDLAIFASGYEKRCTQSILALDSNKFAQVVVIGFSKVVAPNLRRRNDNVFLERTGSLPRNDKDVDLPLYLLELLSNVTREANQADRPARILIDYSSMHRQWYGYILTVMNHLLEPRPIAELDFLYSNGVYPQGYESSVENAVLESISPLPAMEGLSASRSSSIAILGLGFSPIAGLGALERLQPDRVYCFVANPGSDHEHVKTALRCNRPLIEKASALVELPLYSLSTAYRGLTELTWPYVDRYHINILPMGPKPHILASMLVAQTFRSVSCLYGKIDLPSGPDIEGNGQYCIGSVVFEA